MNAWHCNTIRINGAHSIQRIVFPLMSWRLIWFFKFSLAVFTLLVIQYYLDLSLWNLWSSYRRYSPFTFASSFILCSLCFAYIFSNIHRWFYRRILYSDFDFLVWCQWQRYFHTFGDCELNGIHSNVSIIVGLNQRTRRCFNKILTTYGEL